MPPPMPLSSKSSAKRTITFILGFGIPLGVMGVVLPLLLSTKQTGATLSSNLCGPPPGSIESFLSPDVTFGNLTVSQARAIDISWNLFMGRGLQGLIGFASYQTATRSFIRIVEATPVSYDLFKTLIFSPNGFSALKALIMSLRRTIGRRFNMTFGFLFMSTSFILALPTIMDICTGYVQNVQPYWQHPNGSLELATSNEPPPFVTLPAECMVQDGYQWGFSSPWVLTLSSIFLLWVIGMCGIWADANRSSEMHKKDINLGPWKAIIDLGKVMDFQLGDRVSEHSDTELAKRVATSSPVRYVKIVNQGSGSEQFRLLPAPSDAASKTSEPFFDTSKAFMPKSLFGIRLLQLAVAFIEIALCAYLTANTTGGGFGSVIFAIFCSVVSVIVAGYSIAERFATSSYIIWVALSLDTVLSIFWLSAMSALAALRNLLIMPSYLLDKRTLQRRYMLAWASNDWLAIESAVIAIAAIQTILFFASFSLSSIRLHRNRNSYTPINRSEDAETLLSKPSLQKDQIQLHTIDLANH